MVVHRAGNAGAANFGDPVHGHGGGGGASDGIVVKRGTLKAVGIFFGDKRCGDVARPKARVIHHGGNKRQVVTDAFHLERVQRQSHLINRGVACCTPGAQLCNHRVIEHRDLAALKHAGIIAHHAAARRRPFNGRAVPGQAADGRQKTAVGIFGIQARFHGPAIDFQIGLLERQLFSGGDPDHLFDQINAGDEFGYRVFHLQTGVHFQKVKLAVAVNDKFDGACRCIAHGAGQCAGLRPHCLAGGGIQKRRRGLLDHFLIAPLDRAFAFMQINNIAMLIGQHLNFDMPGLGDELFNKNPVVAK